MTFPSGGPGYPQQGGAQPYQQTSGAGSPPPGAANSLNLPLLLALAVAVLGLVEYFIGFSDEADAASGVIRYLLVSGLLAGLYALPKGPKVLPFAALFSVLGAFESIDLVIGVPASGILPGVITVVLILGILQMLIAVGALLLEYGVVKLKAAQPQGPYGQPGQQQYPQQSQFGQQATPNQPPANPGPGQQPTTYAPQQGQFFQQPSAESGPQSPGTPPGGFGQQS